MLNWRKKPWSGRRRIQPEITCGKLRLTKLRRLEKETARERREAAWKRGVINAPHIKSKESDKKRRERKESESTSGIPKKKSPLKKMPSPMICIDEVRSVSSSRANRMLRLRRSFARCHRCTRDGLQSCPGTLMTSLVSDFLTFSLQHPTSNIHAYAPACTVLHHVGKWDYYCRHPPTHQFTG